MAEIKDATVQMEELTGSLDKILQFSECDPEVASQFKARVATYKNMQNKTGSDEVSRRLRHELTSLFYKVYIAAFQVSIKQKELPVVVRMFLEFGYVDEELAGIQNAAYMYQLAQDMPTSPEHGVYSIYQWLMAIFRGEKEPGRNEFDMDYTEYLREQKKKGAITAEQEKALLNSNGPKVMFELQNVFPAVNKITYGRPSVFCPVFSRHNMLKPIESALVTAEKIVSTLEEIRRIDFGAFYRETMFSDPERNIPGERISVEVLPDVILTPNAGSRGIMWQEIEGKKRTTPARMMISIFQMEELQGILMQLTAEFRWEMCKRVQGGRWNDVSEPSLTSEYCDYVQFYRKNKDLSADTKEKVKAQLAKCRNNYKEMFISDYIMWLRFESTGAPRLNKVARRIIFTYCPFAKEVRTKLAINPLYKDFMEKYTIKQGQKMTHVNNVCQRILKTGKDIPEEIENHKRFLNM